MTAEKEISRSPAGKSDGEKGQWHWEEIPFIPATVVARDMLRFQGHIFIKSNVLKEMKSKGVFKPREKRERKKKMQGKLKKELK